MLLPILVQGLPPEVTQAAPPQYWWLIILINLIAGGIIGIWVYLSKQYLPNRDKRIEAKLQAELEERQKQTAAKLEEAEKLLEARLNKEKEDREYKQQTENAALDIAKETIQWFREYSQSHDRGLKEMVEAVNALKSEYVKHNNIEEKRLEWYRAHSSILTDIEHHLNAQQGKISALVDLLTSDRVRE